MNIKINICPNRQSGGINNSLKVKQRDVFIKWILKSPSVNSRLCVASPPPPTFKHIQKWDKNALSTIRTALLSKKLCSQPTESTAFGGLFYKIAGYFLPVSNIVIKLYNNSTFPYSFSYSIDITSPGSLFFFLIGTKGTFNSKDNNGPIRNPLESSPTIHSIGGTISLTVSISTSVKLLNTSGFCKTEKISLKKIYFSSTFIFHMCYIYLNKTPGIGKSG